MAMYKCENCGKLFDRQNQRYLCSDECRKEYKAKQKPKRPTKKQNKTKTWFEQYTTADRFTKLAMMQKTLGKHYGELSILYGENGSNPEYKKLLKRAKEMQDGNS